jgi:hypothetical protein
MPTKERRQRDKAKREAEAATTKFIDSAPEWVKSQTTCDEPDLAQQIRDSCEAFRQMEGNKRLKLKPGLLIATPDGELIENTEAMARGAKRINIAKQQDAGNRARLKKEKYASVWGDRSAAKRIADAEGLKALSTVYRWFKQAP